MDGERDELNQRTSEEVVTWRAYFYWDSRLAGGRRSFEDDQASNLLQKILSGILWVREYCRGAENLAAG